MFRIAPDMSQIPASQLVYIEGLPMFIQVAEEFGIHGIVHTDYESTRAKPAVLGLEFADIEKDHL